MEQITQREEIMVKRWWMIDKLSNSLESAKIDKEICRTILQDWDQLPQRPKPVGTGDGSLFLFTPFKTLYLKGFQTPFRNALLTHVECLLKGINFRKISNYGVFLAFFGLFKTL